MGLGHELKKVGKKTASVANDIWTHGGREFVTTAGIVAGAILTGGAVAGMAGVGGAAGAASAAAGTTALGSVTAGSALAGGAATLGTATTAGLLGGGYAAYSKGKARHEERKLATAAAQEQAEINKANALAETQRRANLLSLRKQVGAVNVGSKSTVFSGGGSEEKQNATGVILG